MKKVFATLFFLTFVTVASAQNIDNPGFFKSPGFIAATLASTDHTRGVKDATVRPNVLGLANLFQSEYGNIALGLGLALYKPKSRRGYNGNNYLMTSEQLSTEIGLFYTTGSKTVNFLAGAGISNNYITTKFDGFSDSYGLRSNYSKTYYSSQFGWQFYLGSEYRITNDGRWGLIGLVKWQFTDSPIINHNRTITLEDGSTMHFEGSSAMNLNVTSYSLGVSYHF